MGLPTHFLVGRAFIGSDSVALILGDNIFYGHGLPELLMAAGLAAAGRDHLCLRRIGSGTLWGC